MTVSVLKNVNLLSLTSTIASAAICTVGAFAALEINNRAEAIVVTGDPNNYIVSPGTGFDGVVRLDINTNLGSDNCSGSLLSTGLHILTAAHCVSDDLGFNLIINNTKAFFDIPGDTVGIDVTKFFIHPNWGGLTDFESVEGDIAILELSSFAPQAAERYDIYRNNDEVGQVGIKVGYGLSGQGNQGFDPDNFPFGVKRFGQNKYDAPAEVLNSRIPELGRVGNNTVPGAVLAYDFDNGLPENDAFAYFGIPNLGLGMQEVTTAPGDSGGPTFINGLIAGVTSFGTCFNEPNCSTPPDIDNFINASFGEFGGDTRVSTYASYIDDVLAGKIAPTKQISEPNTIFGTVFALAAFAISSRFQRRGKGKARATS
ncbi:trypsin-like serine protease [Aerosakkonemataceae cyanobacterium BLCC-F50]|uniref:Trypsin-like serine protease n=1 Tax=Floridaenema flaviceps BLCC-F50 TaxID=3153642 RepID=A0ABV4XQ18_9CYAN